MPTSRKKLIEVGLPLPEINDASAYDKMPGIGAHPKGIHQWWARLPLPTARAVLFASVVDDPSSHPDKYPTEEAQKTQREKLFHMLRNLMQKKAHDHPEFYAEAREEMLKHCEGKLPPVLDPFAGVLCLFLLDMGLVAGRGLKQGWKYLSLPVTSFAVVMPLLGATIADRALNLQLVLCTQVASRAHLLASYLRLERRRSPRFV